MQEEAFGRVCAVVVTYNTGSRFDASFNSLKSQVDHAFLVNTSGDGGTTRAALQRLETENPGFVTVIESPLNNLGMAQNLGVKAGLAAGFDWFLLLDHDSHLQAGMVAAMERAYRQETDPQHIAILSACLLDPDVTTNPKYLVANGKRAVQESFGEDVSVIRGILCVSASGSLIPRRVFEAGFWLDESFIIDFIDTDFCLKLVTAGQKIIAVRDAGLVHRIGERKEHKFLGLKVTTTNHSPLRRYYQYRNRVAVWKRYAGKQRGFVLFDLMRVAYELWRIILFESQKLRKLDAAFSGITDGLLGRSGAKKGMSITRAF